jgi:hypothetical protein
MPSRHIITRAHFISGYIKVESHRHAHAFLPRTKSGLRVLPRAQSMAIAQLSFVWPCTCNAATREIGNHADPGVACEDAEHGDEGAVEGPERPRRQVPEGRHPHYGV